MFTQKEKTIENFNIDINGEPAKQGYIKAPQTNNLVCHPYHTEIARRKIVDYLNLRKGNKINISVHAGGHKNSAPRYDIGLDYRFIPPRPKLLAPHKRSKVSAEIHRIKNLRRRDRPNAIINIKEWNNGNPKNDNGKIPIFSEYEKLVENYIKTFRACKDNKCEKFKKNMSWNGIKKILSSSKNVARDYYNPDVVENRYTPGHSGPWHGYCIKESSNKEPSEPGPSLPICKRYHFQNICDRSGIREYGDLINKKSDTTMPEDYNWKKNSAFTKDEYKGSNWCKVYDKNIGIWNQYCEEDNVNNVCNEQCLPNKIIGIKQKLLDTDFGRDAVGNEDWCSEYAKDHPNSKFENCDKHGVNNICRECGKCDDFSLDKSYLTNKDYLKDGYDMIPSGDKVYIINNKDRICKN